MTKSRAAHILRFSFDCLHHQRAPSILLRQSGLCNSGRDRVHFTSSAHSLPTHIALPTYSPKARTLYKRAQPSSTPIFSGARQLSSHGLPASQSPSKRPRVSVTKQDLLKLRTPHPESLRSGFGSWTAAAIVFVVALFYSATSGDIGQSHKSTPTAHELLEAIEAEISNMTGEALPGRPGTLTAEQEEKLRQFWIATLEVFGVLDSKDLNGNEATETAARVRSNTTTSKKPKKKRLSLFRKSKEDDTDSVTSTDSSLQVGDSDDKYGQTKEFHDALASLSPESLRATFWSMVKHDHPDALLLRFLRARKWDVEKALVMMVSTMRWRASDMHVDDDIMKNGELSSLEAENGSDPAKRKFGHDFLAQMRLGKSFLHGLDKAGRPMCFVRVRLHKQGEQSEESLERYTVFIIESARMILAPPVDTACVVFDMTGFSLANMDYSPVKFMIKCFEANYPESLGVVLIHKAPWVFQGIWKIVRGWLDPVVASKVHFTNNNEEMEEFVPRSQIIAELGGDEDWSYQYVEPVPGENDIMKDTETRDKYLVEREELVKDYEKATLEWIHGTGEVEKTKIRRNELAQELKEDYWRLDPYLRARSLYDRVGLINPGGKLQFYPDNTEKALPLPNGTAKVETSADDID